MMHKAFEIWVRQRYSNRYDLSRIRKGSTAGKWLNECSKRGATAVALTWCEAGI